MSRGNQTRTKKRGANKNRRVTTGAPLQCDRQGSGEQPIVTSPSRQANYPEIVRCKMEDLRRGQLYHRSGERMAPPDQALNVERHEARAAGAPNLPVKGKAEKTKRSQSEHGGDKRAA